MGESPEELTDRQMAILGGHVAQLLEFFDSVQVFVSVRESSSESESGKCGTGVLERGGGNFYARMGQIREWLLIQDERAREFVRGRDEA